MPYVICAVAVIVSLYFLHPTGSSAAWPLERLVGRSYSYSLSLVKLSKLATLYPTFQRPGMRIMTPFVFGMSRDIKTLRFVIFNALGAVVWSIVISGGGYLFGYAIGGVIKDIRRYQLEVILIVSAVGIILWGVHTFRERRRK